ncbi:MAG: glycoside hydrolase family 99-like domain-containing protein [Delftia tsuruhatensis]|uniref:glycosyltransferase WbsX family protein n=1 Tax=Delftia lacustris TaxID=558537 RepID=UPI0035A66059
MISEKIPVKSSDASPRIIAFYLTQFHPTAENDRWWGKGFTEWTNVTKSLPLFHGHYQPHLPADLGFYDLRVKETRHEQIIYAKNHGIDGFCYHYYWFSGTRILNAPLDAMFSDPESDMPFCLCWANENWTRRWDAAENEVLIAQKYLPDDDLNFIKSLIPFFEDGRYIKVDGKPFLIVYRPQHLPDSKKSISIWREYCLSIGLGEIFVCAALTHGNEDYVEYGFDAGVEFPPHNLKIANINGEIPFHEKFYGNVMDYAQIAGSFLNKKYKQTAVFKTVFPSWDNAARTKERSLIVLNGNPENYEYWLSSTLDLCKEGKCPDQLVFINAWNEWAEGCHLEPDRRYGDRFLQATLNAKNGVRRFSDFQSKGIPEEVWKHRRKLIPDLLELFSHHAVSCFESVQASIIRRPWLHRILLPFVRLVRKLKN